MKRTRDYIDYEDGGKDKNKLKRQKTATINLTV